METIAFYAQNGDQYHGRNTNFQEISCRTSQYEVGILPNPKYQNTKYENWNMKSSYVPIPISIKGNIRDSMNGFFGSELWAGPAYSNSPPPSSLPIPNFSIKPKRTVSLELPFSLDTDVDLLALISKSAPTSPIGEGRKCPETEFVNGSAESATKTLCRILNIDMVESD